jgi:hypothetical protein
VTLTERNTAVFSKATELFLEQLDVLSNNSLVYRKELGILLELSRHRDAREQLARLAFAAKFCWSTYSIMARVGPAAEGYDRLLAEFNDNAGKSHDSIKRLLIYATDGDRSAFDRIFFSNTQESLRARLDFYHDLSWIQNWLIDHNTDIPV